MLTRLQAHPLYVQWQKEELEEGGAHASELRTLLSCARIIANMNE